MSVHELRVPAIFAGLFFLPGVIFIVVDIVMAPWQPTGLFLLGVVFLGLWLWLIGGLRRGFWIQEDRYAEPWPLDALEQEGHR